MQPDTAVTLGEKKERKLGQENMIAHSQADSLSLSKEMPVQQTSWG